MDLFLLFTLMYSAIILNCLFSGKPLRKEKIVCTFAARYTEVMRCSAEWPLAREGKPSYRFYERRLCSCQPHPEESVGDDIKTVFFHHDLSRE